MASNTDVNLSLKLEEPQEQNPDGPPGAAPAPVAPGGPLSGPVQGYQREVLVGDPQNKFLCIKCDRVLKDPVQSECGHR